MVSMNFEVGTRPGAVLGLIPGHGKFLLLGCEIKFLPLGCEILVEYSSLVFFDDFYN